MGKIGKMFWHHFIKLWCVFNDIKLHIITDNQCLKNSRMYLRIRHRDIAIWKLLISEFIVYFNTAKVFFPFYAFVCLSVCLSVCLCVCVCVCLSGGSRPHRLINWVEILHKFSTIANLKTFFLFFEKKKILRKIFRKKKFGKFFEIFFSDFFLIFRLKLEIYWF